MMVVTNSDIGGQTMVVFHLDKFVVFATAKKCQYIHDLNLNRRYECSFFSNQNENAKIVYNLFFSTAKRFLVFMFFNSTLRLSSLLTSISFYQNSIIEAWCFLMLMHLSQLEILEAIYKLTCARMTNVKKLPTFMWNWFVENNAQISKYRICQFIICVTYYKQKFQTKLT